VTRPLYAIGRSCVRYRWFVLAAWVVVAAVLVALAHHAGEDTNDNLTLPGTDSEHATTLLTQHLPSRANGTVPLVLHAKTGTLRDARYATPIQQTVQAYAKNPEVLAAVSPLSPQGKAFLGRDAKTGYISLALKLAPSDLSIDEAHDLFALADPARHGGLQVEAGGYLGQKLSKPATESSEVVGIACAMIVLLFTFGTAVAMGLPILTAIIGLGSALSVITLLGHATDVPRTAPTLATMIGLGVGIDYALFLVTRYREGVRTGMSRDEAIARAVATDGAAVVFAGITVVIAICSLALAGIPLVSVLGYASAIAVFTAVLGAITLLPAILAILGRRIDSVRLPERLHSTHADPDHSFWARAARTVTRHPVVAVVVALAILLPLAAPVFTLTLGQQDIGALSTSTTARRAYDLMSSNFGQGSNGPLLVAVQLPSPANGPNDPRLQKLEGAVLHHPNVAAVTPAALSSNRTVAVFTATAKSAPSENSTASLVKDLRSNTIPQTLGGKGNAYVGGTTASYVDLASQIGHKLPFLIAVVIALSFLVLLLAFHSVVIPLQAAVMNLVSVGASYGVLTAIFEHGWGIGIVGLDHSVPIVSFVPLMMFAVLFGLSMDYEVFLMSHIQEAYKATRDNTESVVRGLATSGRVITSAALIMVSVFASFILNGDPTIKQFGVGLAVAVALDATIVRCLLVPALMVLMHGANWYLPGWLGRVLPSMNLEGEEFFAGRDAAERATPATPATPA
jgi:putative drug exporter of the RND superfamily